MQLDNYGNYYMETRLLPAQQIPSRLQGKKNRRDDNVLFLAESQAVTGHDCDLGN